MHRFYLLLPFFTYFPRLIPGVETQSLLIFLVAIASLVISARNAAKVHFIMLSLVLLVVAIANLASTGNLVSSVLLFQLAIGPIIIFGAICQRLCVPERKYLNAIAIFYLLALAFELIFPAIYRDVALFLIGRASVADGHRGVSLLTPEPTYAAISMAYFLILALWTRRQGATTYPWVEFVFFTLLVMTLSTYLVLFLLAVCVAKWPKATLLVIISFFVVLSSFHWVAMGNDDSIRLVVAISRILAADFSNFLPSLSATDSSVASRVLTNFAAFSTAMHSSFGLGLGCQAMPMAFELAGFDYAFDNPVLRSVMTEGCLKPQSFLAFALLGLGMAGVVYVLLLSIVIFKCIKRYEPDGAIWPVPFALAVLMLVVQCQVTNPIPWLLIYMSLMGNRMVKKEYINFRPISLGGNIRS